MSRFSMVGRVCGRSEVGAVRLASRGPNRRLRPSPQLWSPWWPPATVAARVDAGGPDAVRNAVRPWLIPGGSGSPLGGPRQPCVTMLADTCTLEVRNVGNGLAFIEPEQCYLSLDLDGVRRSRRAAGPAGQRRGIDRLPARGCAR